MKAKSSKSRILCIKASSGKVYSPCLSIGWECMQPVGNSAFKFLGMHIRVPPDPAEARNSLKESLEAMLRAIDAVPVTRNHKREEREGWREGEGGRGREREEEFKDCCYIKGLSIESTVSVYKINKN